MADPTAKPNIYLQMERYRDKAGITLCQARSLGRAIRKGFLHSVWWG
jgi:hypothetical protein